MIEFTPISAAIGGALIGIAAVLLFRFNGRIAGISGIAAGLFTGKGEDFSWRIAFVLGLVSGPFVYAIFAGKLPDSQLDAGFGLVIIGGLLVGFGTRLGSGCTSGHGICGLSRLSIRSLAAVAIFMLAGILVVTASRHWFGA